MSDFITKFIDAMAANGCAPASASDIVADNKMRRIKAQGERNPTVRYCLDIDGDFAYGWFIDFKQHGEAIAWHSTDGTELSPEEQKARKAHYAKMKREREKQEQELFKATAKEVREVWDGAKEKQHPYLKKKGIGKTGTRVADIVGDDGEVQENVLLIPMYKASKLTSLQRIWPNGFKAFWANGDVKGAYTAFVEKKDPKDTIVICEGYATGATIREAMGDWPVIVAFNAGNLVHVARFFRGKYPKSRIIIAADNDQWTLDKTKREGIGVEDPKALAGDAPEWEQWREEGRLQNPGLEKARQAAVKVGAHVIYPDIDASDKAKNTDFNDMQKLHGLEAVRKRILVAAPASAPQDRVGGGDSFAADSPSKAEMMAWHAQIPDAEYEQAIAEHNSIETSALYGIEKNEDAPVPVYGDWDFLEDEKEIASAPWAALLEYNEEEKLKSNSLTNARVLIDNLTRYKGMFCYDDFTQEKIVTRCPPWQKNPQKFKPRPLRDEDKTELTMDLEKRRIRISIQNISKVLDTVIVRNTQNPAQAYFNGLKWDGVSRLHTWLRTYAGCVEEDPEYLAAIGTKWITAIVARVMNPGCKFDSMLILEGEQNLGKSALFKSLSTIHGRAYFDDTIKAREIGNEKIVMKLQGCLIVELAEMTGFDKMPAEEIKQVLSSQVDRIIKKYQVEPTELKRKFVFAGTINKMAGYLNDPTGNRRYWPAKATKIDLVALEKDKEQLWAEAVQRYRDGEPLWIDDPKVYKKAEREQRKRMNLHPWQADIEKLARNRHSVVYSDIWDALSIGDRTRRTVEAQKIITGIMVGLGYELTSERVDNVNKQTWKLKKQPDFLEKMTKEDEEEISW